MVFVPLGTSSPCEFRSVRFSVTDVLSVLWIAIPVLMPPDFRRTGATKPLRGVLAPTPATPMYSALIPCFRGTNSLPSITTRLKGHQTRYFVALATTVAYTSGPRR